MREIYRSAVGSLRGLALLLLFMFVLIAFVMVRDGYEVEAGEDECAELSRTGKFVFVPLPRPVA